MVKTSKNQNGNNNNNNSSSDKHNVVPPYKKCMKYIRLNSINNK